MANKQNTAKEKIITIKKPATGKTDGTDVIDMGIQPRTTAGAILKKAGLDQEYALRADGQASDFAATDDVYAKVGSGTKLQAVLKAEVALL